MHGTFTTTQEWEREHQEMEMNDQNEITVGVTNKAGTLVTN